MVNLLRLTPELTDPAQPVPLPAGPGDLVDPHSGVVVRAGPLTALVAADPSDAVVIADRLGRYVDSDATLHGVPLRDVALATVRERILVADNDAHLFTGVLRSELDPYDTAQVRRYARTLARRTRPNGTRCGCGRSSSRSPRSATWCVRTRSSGVPGTAPVRDRRAGHRSPTAARVSRR